MRILVVETELNAAKLLQKGLEAEYYAVDIALDGNQAVKMTQGGEYDLLVINVDLDQSFGSSIVAQMREFQFQNPILTITSNNKVATRVAALNNGADDIILKPFHFEELSARIRAVFRRRNIIQSEKLIVGDLFLDPVAHEVRYKNEPIDLRNREFDLLEYLMRNAGRVVTRNMVLEHVWDINADSFSNTIEVHITHLRKKLGDAGCLIKTIRGVGYKLICK